MKILFLDIDGVLNDVAFYEHVKNFPSHYSHAKDQAKRAASRHLNPMAVQNLRYVLDEDKEVRIVISSTWRKYHSLESLKWIFKKHGIPSEKIIGKTDIPPPGTSEGTGPQDLQRGDLCLKWATENGVANFVCVDDDNDFDRVRDRLVRTNYKNGFIRTKAEEVLRLFGATFDEVVNDFGRNIYVSEPDE